MLHNLLQSSCEVPSRADLQRCDATAAVPSWRSPCLSQACSLGEEVPLETLACLPQRQEGRTQCHGLYCTVRQAR